MKAPVTTTGGKDLTDFHKAGGNLRDWLGAALRRVVPVVDQVPAVSAGEVDPVPAAPPPVVDLADSELDRQRGRWAAVLATHSRAWG